jgi:hypothetical protein
VQAATGAGMFRAEPILETVPLGNIPVWVDTNFQALRNLEAHIISLQESGRFEDLRRRDAIPVGLAVTDRDQKPRLLVFGAARWASNYPQGLPGLSPEDNKDLFVSSLEWLVERRLPSIGISPKRSNFYRLRVPEGAFGRMAWLPASIMILGIVGLGMGVWVVRRR